MQNITTLTHLFIEQAREIYDAEVQQLEVIKEILPKINSPELKQLVTHHIDQIKLQKERLEKVFAEEDELSSGEQNQVMAALIKELIEIMNRSADSKVRDAGLIGSLQQIKHFEMAAYGTLCAFAKTLKKIEEANALHHNLEEEKGMDAQLSHLARNTINKEALSTLIL
ncbi:DUF892 family protein [Echinicola jeungdonensis]|uniref:Ferritin-like domain-containing protein n=1 Tax=Echinicola jeungdonensis TaxID=709343 RepID=A0ABV5J5Z8_9BACT|nr:DUF892 family protein [Echinicola jeungdonensis]MDN3668099.1 DUF892 family protein [Echinicola jeungdonensis]MDN3671253.1 DUF892 family protein [Echinicola jeungdonensis]MDN3671267.1 DUF892 family protein [Echinicola jeungdonensis]